MKKLLTISLAIAALFFANPTWAQNIAKGQPGMYPSFIDFKDAPVAFKKGSVVLADESGKFAASSSAKLNHNEKDMLGMEHYRYQQTYNGIPVEHAVYVVHVISGKISSQNGSWVKDFPAELKTTPALSKTTALNKAMAFIGAKEYKWQVPAEEAFIKQEQNDRNATFFPKGELVLYSGENEIEPGALRLAYKFDIYAHYPASRQIVFVDAQNGKILGKRELIHTTNATGTAVTAYSGTQTITTDNTGTTYRLRETGRGNGIQTLNMKTAGTNYASAVDFTDADNNWNNVNTNKDQYATDAHWGAEKTYDYYFTKYNRNSIDNAGFALKNYVHVNLVAQGYPDNVNAFWDGSRMSYGDGNSSYAPLTALDIAGHEITHGLTENTSSLNYSNESGAMNEGFSDIFGTAIEFYARPTRANWTIGEDIGASFRSMSNPNQFSQPDTYQGTYWYTGTADNGGVHTNSGVLNFWFYLLSQGGSGTNDKGTAYSVTGLGIDKAAAIAFRTNTVYLVSTSNYAAARTYAIKSAEDLYGVGSNEANQTSCAWAAVGVGTCGVTSTCNAPTGLASSAITNTSATVSWTAVSGASSYAVDYKLNSASTWTSAATATTSTSVNLSGLTAASLYNFRVRTNCSSSNSAYTQANFTTTGGTGCSAAFEPNETQAAAATISSGVVNSAAISSTTDIDYYKIVTTSSSNNVYNLVGPSGVDYDLYIYNSSGTQIGAGETGTATETVSLNTQAAGTYYIKVVGYNGANSATCYTIKATATAITGCQSSYDVSTNGTTAGAATIPFNTNITGLISPSADVDNYKFVITTAGTITVTLGTLPADYDLKLLNSAGTQVGISQNGSTTSESISYTAAAGTYYAQAYGYNGANSATTCYTLKVQLGTASITGVETAQDKLSIYPNPVTSLLNINVPGAITGQGTIKIIDAKGTIIAQQKVINKLQKIDVSKFPGGVYLLQVNNGKENSSLKFVKE
jgi:bacillolysin